MGIVFLIRAAGSLGIAAIYLALMSAIIDMTKDAKRFLSWEMSFWESLSNWFWLIAIILIGFLVTGFCVGCLISIWAATPNQLADFISCR